MPNLALKYGVEEEEHHVTQLHAYSDVKNLEFEFEGRILCA